MIQSKYKVQNKCDVLIIGSGIIGLSIGIWLLRLKPSLKVIILDKEAKFGQHASGRNSGVLHAGFYYSPDSLKAKFCKEGNQELRLMAGKYQVPVRDIGKVVVATNLEDNEQLDSLLSRGISNGVDLELLDESKLSSYEPLAKTVNRFLWSPTTAISSPNEIINAFYKEFIYLGGRVDLNVEGELELVKNEVVEKSNNYNFTFLVNAAGAQANRISKSVNVGLEYSMIPFMGVYRVTDIKKIPLSRLVYPVPHAINPFLGVHFTLTMDNKVKVGPTAIPVFGREQYSMLKGFPFDDFTEFLKGSLSLITGKTHDFSAILASEVPKFFTANLISKSSKLVPLASTVKTWQKKPPGIRSQLVHLPTGRLEQDFIVRKYANSCHILNAVSPGWTSSLAFSRWVALEHILPNIK